MKLIINFLGDQQCIQIFDSNGLRGVLHYASSTKSILDNIKFYVLTISNTNTVPLNCITLNLSSKSTVSP